MSTTATNPITNMNNAPTTPATDPLAQLRDIHLPDPISSWPPAPGWWLLLAGIALLVVIIWLGYRYYQKGAMRRAALDELSQIAIHYQTEPQQQIQQLSQLLRRVALVTQPPKTVAGINEQAWLDFLDQFTSQQKFTLGIGQVLSQGPYQKTIPTFEAEPLITLCHNCIKSMFKRRISNV